MPLSLTQPVLVSGRTIPAGEDPTPHCTAGELDSLRKHPFCVEVEGDPGEGDEDDPPKSTDVPGSEGEDEDGDDSAAAAVEDEPEDPDPEAAAVAESDSLESLEIKANTRDDLRAAGLETVSAVRQYVDNGNKLESLGGIGSVSAERILEALDELAAAA